MVQWLSRYSWAVFFVLVSFPAANADVIISEFMASNRSFLADENGEYPDWVELYNTGPVAVSLEGWTLTDDTDELGKWVFPAVEMAPGEFLLVFASGKDRRDPAAQLHTNFQLLSTGESLVLAAPGDDIRSLIVDFPLQLPDRSYGFEMELSVEDLIPIGAEAKYFIPTDSSLDDVWQDLDFDVGDWATGATPIGFDNKPSPTLAESITTDLADTMQGVNTGLYVRLEFDVQDSDLSKIFALSAIYEDGLVVSVNGNEMASRNITTVSRRYSSRARLDRPESESLIFELIPMPGASQFLEVGRNVLSIQALNQSRSDEDFLIGPNLRAIEVIGVNQLEQMYFENPSPLFPNESGLEGVAEAPEYSEKSGAYSGALSLELTAGEGVEIRFTTDNSVPTRGSALYTGPISVATTTVVQAVAFEEGKLPSLPSVESYVFLHSTVANLRSDLPLVIINTFGRTIPATGSATKLPMHIHVIDRDDDGFAAITATPVYSGAGEIKERGSSSAGRPKKSFTFEIQDEAGDDRDVAFFGWPAESDYILYGAYNFDHALMRNPFIYEISNQVGRYAARSQFCEVYLNTGTGPITSQNYWGVYSFMEKLKWGPGRIDIDVLQPEDVREPEVSGGYVTKIDRADPGDSGFNAGGQGMRYVYPKEDSINASQRTFLTGFFGRMASSLRSANALDPELGMIDVNSWIDHHILNVFPKNVDAFRLSGYFYLPRSGKMNRGPIWDYDRSMGSTDGRDRFPTAWTNNGGDGGTRYFANDFYGSLFVGQQPPLGSDEWATRYRGRWRELREGPLSTENIVAVINGMAAETQAGWIRNRNKWRQGSSQAVAVNTLRSWLTQRVAWIDSQFLEPPVPSVEPGDFVEAFDLEFETLNGATFYTVNGVDPMTSNGALAEGAVEYTAPIRIAGNTRIWARSRVGQSSWSGEVKLTYVFERISIVVTEIMYNPLDDSDEFGTSDFEFVEFFNPTDEEISLEGVRLAERRLSFDFSESTITVLGPREYALIVRNPEAFVSRYGEGLPIVGEINISLSNSRQAVRIVGSVDEELLSFVYEDDWGETTDGDGYSLVPSNPFGDRFSFADGANWGPSAAIFGSPGRADGDIDPPGLRLQGDINGDDTRNISDGVALLRYLFAGNVNLPCGDGSLGEPGNFALANLDGNDAVNLTDAVYLLNYLFRMGDPPTMGAGCAEFVGCETLCSN